MGLRVGLKTEAHERASRVVVYYKIHILIQHKIIN